MGVYEDKLNDFLAEPGNFDFAWEIYEAIPKLRDRLRVELLDAFKPYVSEQVEGTGWTCARFDDVRVGITKEAWEQMFLIDFYVGPQYLPSLGLWHEKKHPLLEGRRDEFIKATEATAKRFKGMNNGTSSIWYYRLGTNFETQAELKALLPANRPELIEDYWQQMWKFAQAFEPELDKIVRNLKKASP